MGLKDANLTCLHSIAAATDSGRRPALAQGDWNITAAELNDSGILDGLGLDIVLPSNSTYTCTAGSTGSLIDYVVCTKGCKAMVASCEVVREVPCGTHLGVRTTFHAHPVEVMVQVLKKPKPLAQACQWFEAKGLLPDRKTVSVISCEDAANRTKGAETKQVIENLHHEITEYLEPCGELASSRQAAIEYAHWSAACELRLLHQHGVDVPMPPMRNLNLSAAEGLCPRWSL